MMVQLITLFQSSQNGDGIFNAWFSDKHLLEATLQRGIFFNVLTILVQRSGADAVKFTTRQRRFQHVPGIHCAVSFTRAPPMVCSSSINRMTLPSCFARSFSTPFRRSSNSPRYFAPGHQRAHIQRQYATAFQPFGHFAINDTLRQPFNDGGFTDARLTNQHRVVFGTTLQYLDSPTNFFVTADYRVKFALLGTFGQVDRKFLQSLTLVFGSLVVHAFTSAHFLNRLGHISGGCTGG
ncbi:hypothetical protein HR12_10415, partial [Microbacterium sp. SUBG005]